MPNPATESDQLPATRPVPTPDAARPPTGHYPVAHLPEAEVVDETYGGLSGLVLTPEQQSVVTEELPAEAAEVRPQGEVYFPWPVYVRQLNRLFGAGRWGLRPLGPLVKQGDLVAREWGLYAHGHFVAQAMGAQEWKPTNRRMTYDDAIEAATSNALMRCCKRLGLALQAWDKRWIAWFLETHCVQVWVLQGVRVERGQVTHYEKVAPQWRRIDAGPFREHGVVIERGTVAKPEAAIAMPVTTEDGDDPPSAEPAPAPAVPRRETRPAADAPEDMAAAMRAEAETPPPAPAVPPRRDLTGVLDPAQVQQVWIAAREGKKSRDEVHAYILKFYNAHSVKQVPKICFDALKQWLVRRAPEEPPPGTPAARIVCRSRGARR